MSEWRGLVRIVVNSGTHSPWRGSGHTAISISHCAWKEPCAKETKNLKTAWKLVKPVNSGTIPDAPLNLIGGDRLSIQNSQLFWHRRPQYHSLKNALKRQWVNEQKMVASERDQKMSLQNILLWRIDYSELKGTEKWQMPEGLSTIPLSV